MGEASTTVPTYSLPLQLKYTPSFIFLSIFGIFTLVVYCVIAKALIQYRKIFNTTYYRLFLLSAFLCIVSYLDSWPILILPNAVCRNCTFSSFYQQHTFVGLDTLRFIYVYVNHTITYVEILMIFNRYTAIAFHFQYKSFWNKFSYYPLIIVFAVPAGLSFSSLSSNSYPYYKEQFDSYAIRSDESISKRKLMAASSMLLLTISVCVFGGMTLYALCKNPIFPRRSIEVKLFLHALINAINGTFSVFYGVLSALFPKRFRQINESLIVEYIFLLNTCISPYVMILCSKQLRDRLPVLSLWKKKKPLPRTMDEIQAMSDAQLRAELVKQGANVGPVTGTTRGVFEKKLFKLRQSAPAAPLTPKAKKTITPPVVVPKVAASSSVRRSTRKNINRSESEEGSDDEIEIISPKQNSTSTARKPVSSTPTRERTPSPPAPKRSVRRPANSIIPGLNTTLNSNLNSVKSTTVTTSKLFITPGGDQPGSTPPRKILRTPPRSVTHASGSTSSFLSPDATLNISPKFSVHTSSVTRRNLATLGHTTEEDDSDAGEETSRVVHNIVSSGKDRRSGVRRALDGFLGNDLSAGDHPGSNYELRRGTIRTNVVRDSKTGRLSVKQRSVWSDIPRMLLLILICFFVVLGIAYVIASRPENFASTISLVKTTVRDTCEFFYKYAVLPVAIATGACVAITGLYFAHKWYREKQAKEQEAFEDLVEKIIDMVQDETENGEENITVPHVRDKMYPPAKRSAGHMALWERAVQFINENESRIATECALIRGQECQVWRWIPYKKSGWQGSAFHTPIAKKSTENGTEKSTDKYLSSNIPAVALTRCLKVRDIHENRDGKHPLEPINFDALKYQILEKVYPIRPVHLQFDPLNQDSVLYMKLNNKEDAKAAFDSLHAKWFNGHLITVKYVRDSRYNDRFPITSNV